MSQDEIELKCYELLEEYDLEINELPEKLQRKFEQLDDLIEEFEECDADSDEESECELRIEAMDTGITELLNEHIEKMVEEAETSNAQQIQQQNFGNGGQPTQSNEQKDTPSWRFWM